MNEKVKFIDTSTEVKKAMVSLSKKALKESGKVVTKILKSKIPVKTGGLKKSVKAWAIINNKTGQPELRVGYLTVKKMQKQYGIKYFVNPAWFEFGTKPHIITVINAKVLTDGIHMFGRKVMHPGMTPKNYLRNTAFNNVNEIKNAQKKYLGELNKIILKKGGKIPYEAEGDDLIG
jgi:hypothetical protein